MDITLPLILALTSVSIFIALYYLNSVTNARREQRRILRGAAKSMEDAALERAEYSLMSFSKSLYVIRQQISVLNQHTTEYYHTLQGAGWSQLQNTLFELNHAENHLIQLLDDKHYEDVRLLADLLTNRLPPSEASRIMDKFPTFSHLTEWERECSATLLSVIQELEAAATHTQNLGISRQRKRQPTLLDITSIKKQLYPEGLGE